MLEYEHQMWEDRCSKETKQQQHLCHKKCRNSRTLRSFWTETSPNNHIQTIEHVLQLNWSLSKSLEKTKRQNRTRCGVWTSINQVWNFTIHPLKKRNNKPYLKHKPHLKKKKHLHFPPFYPPPVVPTPLLSPSDPLRCSATPWLVSLGARWQWPSSSPAPGVPRGVAREVESIVPRAGMKPPKTSRKVSFRLMGCKKTPPCLIVMFLFHAISKVWF